jgi:hypothetical protein
MAINLDHVTEQITVTDTAANASLTVNPKGTGAFNIAAGSGGINLSNGGTVTAITRTVLGSYTSNPTVIISAPTTANGVQATATVSVQCTAATIASGGTGYTVGDTISMVGGTFTSVGTFRVATVSGGVITSVDTPNFASYTVTPSNPVSVTGGTGSGATLNVIYFIGTFTITNAGSGYVEQPTVSFSGGGSTGGGAAYATVGSGTVVKSIGSTMSFSTPSGEALRVTDGGGTSNSYLNVIGSIPATGGVYLTSSANSMYLSANNASTIQFFTNGAGNVRQLQIAHTASAVNYVQVTGAATGTPVAISAQGSDSNIRMNLFSKGTESIDILTNGGAVRQARFTNTASTVNWVQMTGSATGFGAVIRAAGSDANIPLVVQPQGTGALQAQQTDSTATGGNARGANAVDFQTLRDTSIKVASGLASVVAGGQANYASSFWGVVSGGYNNANIAFGGALAGGYQNLTAGNYSVSSGGRFNTSGGSAFMVGSVSVGGISNSALGTYNFIGGGFTNSGTSSSAVTTQSSTMNGTTAVTLAASNANIKVGQYISGTSIGDDTYVAAISGTSLTLSKVASGSSTSTLSFFTPHGVVVGGGNNQATGSYSFIGGGGDAGTAGNRNVASGDWSVVGGGRGNIASGVASFVGGGGTSPQFGVFPNTASGLGSSVVGGFANTAANQGAFVGGGFNNLANGVYSAVLGGVAGSTRAITGCQVFSANDNPLNTIGGNQAAMLVLSRQTTDATPTVLASTAAAATTTNQVIMPNNSAYFFTGEVVAGVTGGGNTKGWTIEGVIKRGANAASTALVGTPTVTSTYADAGASTWVIAVTADTTNGGLAVTFTGQAATTIRTVAKISTVEMTF